MLIVCFQDTIYINNKAKVVFSDLESSNGIFHEIDTILVPPGFQIQKDREQDSTPVCPRKHEIMKLHYDFCFYCLSLSFKMWSVSMASRHSTIFWRCVLGSDCCVLFLEEPSTF